MKQQIELAPGVTLVLDGAYMQGHTTANLPPGRYSVEVECRLRHVGGAAQARAEAHFLLEVSESKDGEA